MFVTIMCVVGIAAIVSMWPAAYRTMSNWSALPISVFQCPDPQTLMLNRMAKVQAISTAFFTVAVIPVLIFVLVGR